MGLSSERLSILIHIDKVWSVEDLRELLISIEELYNLRLWFDFFDDALKDLPPNSSPSPGQFSLPIDLLTIPNYVGDRHRLVLERISYGSPGDIQINGFGKAIEQVRKFIENLIHYQTTKERKMLENDLLKVELQKQTINAANELLNIAERLKFTQAQKHKLLDRIFIAGSKPTQLISQGKVKQIEEVKPKGDSENGGPRETGRRA